MTGHALPADDLQQNAATRGKWILAATILASSMAFIDGTAVNVALPALQASLRATAIELQWVVEAYALLLASLLLLGGSLGDLYGRRKIFLLGVSLFTLASVACGLASTVNILIIARALQGVGAAFLVPGSLALISSSFSENDRGRAIGTWSGFTAITAAIGPALGGWFVEHLTWRSVFFINLPLAVAIVGLTLWQVSETVYDTTAELDWKGAILATVVLGAITYSLIEAPHGGAAVWVAGFCGMPALTAFFLVEARASSPMLEMKLFKSRDFTGTNLLTFLLYAPLSGILFFLPLDLIQVQRYSATAAGAALLPLILIIFLLSRWSGALVARSGARLPLTVGPLIAALGFGLFLRCGIAGSYWTTFFPAIVVLGIGMAISVAPLTTAVMQSVPPDHAGMASGVNNAVSRIAGLLAVALFGLILAAGFQRSMDSAMPRLRLSPATQRSLDLQRPQLAGMHTDTQQERQAVDEAFVSGYRIVIWISVLLAVLSAGAAQMLTSKKSAA